MPWESRLRGISPETEVIGGGGRERGEQPVRWGWGNEKSLQLETHVVVAGCILHLIFFDFTE